MFLVLVCAVWLLALPAAAESAPKTVIEEIVFVGNDKTREVILLQEMTVRAGDMADPGRIEASRQAIMDLGLFKSVSARLIPGERGRVLEIEVSEKHYFFPVPKLNRDADGEVSYGVQLRFDNLGGLNQRMRATLKNKEQCCGEVGDEKELNVSYDYPRLVGSQFGLNLGLQVSNRPESIERDGVAIARNDRHFDHFRIGVSRWVGEEGPSSGWSVGLGLYYSSATFEHLSGLAGVRPDELAVGLSGGISYDDVHDLLFSRRGVEFGYDVSQALEAFGSDNNHTIHEFYYRRYWPVGTEPHQNLNFQFKVGFAAGNTGFDQPFGLGGSRDLRGYDKNGLEGRSYFVFNSEYLGPVLGHSAFRGVVFFDVGNTYPDSRMFDGDELEYAAGIGFRYKIKSFVDLQLRGDVGWALGDEGRKAYFGTKHSF